MEINKIEELENFLIQNNKIDVNKWDDDFEIYIPEYDIIIKIDKNKFSIYYKIEFIEEYDFNDYWTFLDNCIPEKSIVIIYEMLYEKFREKPEILDEDIFNIECFTGYTKDEINLSFVKDFIEVVRKFLELTNNGYIIGKMDEEIEEIFVRSLRNPFLDEINCTLTGVLKKYNFQYYAYRNNEINKNILPDKRCSIFLSQEGTSLISLSNVNREDVDFLKNQYFIPVDATYYGIQFLLLKQGDEVVSVDINYVKTFKKILEELKADENITYSISERLVYAKTEDLWATFVTRYFPKEDILNEYKLLENLIVSFGPFAPKKMDFRINWLALSDSKFEEFCIEFLECKGFRNVRKIGKTHAPDGGRDIEAIENISTIAGYETRKWIFQCKHYQKSVNKKDIYGVRDLVEQFKANGYALLSSGELTPEAINYMNSFKDKNIPTLFWTGNDIERELESFPKLILKYNLAVIK